MEHWESFKPDGFRFVYDDTLFRPGTDSFLLSALPQLKKGLRVCDLGCGTGLLGLLLLQRQPELTVTGIDIQPAAIALAQKAAAENHLEAQLQFQCADLRAVRNHFPSGCFDLVVCNPPYYPVQSGKIAQADSLCLARSESSCTWNDICHAASYLLRWGGSFCLVHKPERLTDLLCALRENAMEPKRLRFVCDSPVKAPSLVLIEGRRGGRPGLTAEPPLFLHDMTGAPSPEVDAIYFRT